MSGYSFTGSDIGGFAEQPTGELYTRWIQLGVFHPFCRTHSSGDHGEQEPWAFDDEVIGIVRKFIEIRYQLLPYLYTAFWKYIRQGEPILKSLVLYDQDDTQTHFRSDEFIFGDKILVCPILEPNATGRRMYIPRGKWYNFWDDTIISGGRETRVDADIDSMPIFIREGAIIPKYPIQQYVGEKKIEELTLDVYFKLGKEKSEIYEDANDGYDYSKGRFSLRSFALTGKKNKLTIQQHKLGSFITSYETFNIRIHGLPFTISKFYIDGEEAGSDDIKVNGVNTITISKNFTNLQIKGA
jgi:alpha-glucosidase